MPEKAGPEAMHESLERDIRELEVKLETLKGQKEAARPREVVKEHLAPRIYRGLPPKATAIKPAPRAKPSSPTLPDYIEKYSDEIRLEAEKLIDLAWHKGIDAAVYAAEKEGAFMLDAFHDALTDKLYEKFKEKGLIK
jgi:hypothetical protein